MKKFISYLFISTALFSCATPQQQAAAKQRQYEEDATKCQSYGAKRDSSDFIQCMATIESGRNTTIVREPGFYPSIAYGHVWY